MKKLGTLAIILALAGITFVSIQGCKPKEEGPAKTETPAKTKSMGIESAEATSFKEVTSKLDAGGNFYLYLGTEQWLKGLSGKVEKWHELANSIPDLQNERETVDKAFNAGTRLIKDSGLEDISGIGMSSIAREPGVYCNKMVVHHYAGKGNGFLWSMFGKTPHELDGLSLLPVNTAMAAFYDLDAAQIWSVIQTECEQAGFPQAKEFLKEFPHEFQKNAGIKWEDVMGSLGGEFGFVVTLDDSHKVSFPAGEQQTLEIPEPALMLVIKVKNDAIFNRIDAVLKEQKVPGLVSADQNGVKMRTVPVPLPLPIALRPTVAAGGGYLFIATSDALIQEAMAVKGGKPGLKSTDEFKKLAADIPQQGNQFCFLSQRFGQTITKLQQQALSSNGQVPPQLKELMGSFMQPDKAAFAYAVGANSDEGWMMIANGNQGSGNVLAAASVAGPAMAAAMILPVLAKAKVKAKGISSQKSACLSNLRRIQNAKQQWATENSKPSDSTPRWEDLQPYLDQSGGTPHCPAGGEYTIGAMNQPPTCSVMGHELQ